MIGEDGAAGRGAGPSGVYSGYDGEVVLVFVEVGRCDGVGAVERVEERGVEGAEREFVDDVGEVECWMGGEGCVSWEVGLMGKKVEKSRGKGRKLSNWES